MATLCLAIPSFAAGHAHRTSPAHHLLKHSAHNASRASSQRVIGDSRATEIQTALVGAGYLTGEPSGHWDARTETAMQRFQSDHGWQTKLIPDSRAIIKLGLGPSQQSALSAPLDQDHTSALRTAETTSAPNSSSLR